MGLPQIIFAFHDSCHARKILINYTVVVLMWWQMSLFTFDCTYPTLSMMYISNNQNKSRLHTLLLLLSKLLFDLVSNIGTNLFWYMSYLLLVDDLGKMKWFNEFYGNLIILWFSPCTLFLRTQVISNASIVD